MKERDNNHIASQMDSLLDAAIEHYSAAEPRPGLEQRLRARLSVAPRPSRLRTWHIIVPAALGICIAAGALYLALQPIPRQADGSPTTTRASEERDSRKTESSLPVRTEMEVESTSAPQPPPVVASGLIPSEDGSGAPRQPREMTAMTSLPRLSTFPSVRPPAPQEMALRRYLEIAPQRTVQAAIARTRAEGELKFRDLVIQAVEIDPLEESSEWEDPETQGE